MEKNVRFSSIITNVEKVNPMFSRAKVRILYRHHNRNGSYLTDSSIEKALPSLYNIPIVGEYLEEVDNFGGHGTGIEITDQGIKFIQNTVPYGVVPESAKVYWEEVTEDNGEIKEYLVVDGAYLWTGRYEQLNTLLEQPFGQSMEIEVLNASEAIIDGIETFRIDEFVFSALCILGVDKDGEGHVEPAFESASITAYSLDKDEFKKQFNQMIAELKFSMQGGKSMPTENNQEEVKNEKNYEKTEVEFENVEEVEATEESTTEEVAEETQVDSPSDNPGNSTDAPETFEDESPTDEVEEDTEKDEEAEVEEEAVKENEPEVDYEAKFNEAQSQLETLKADYTSLQSQLAELQSYKRNREEADLKAKFEGKLSDEEFTQIFTEMKDSELDKVEEKLFALIGKKNFSIQTTNKTNINKVAIVSPKEEEFNPYGDIFN